MVVYGAVNTSLCMLYTVSKTQSVFLQAISTRNAYQVSLFNKSACPLTHSRPNSEQSKVCHDIINTFRHFMHFRHIKSPWIEYWHMRDVRTISEGSSSSNGGKKTAECTAISRDIRIHTAYCCVQCKMQSLWFDQVWQLERCRVSNLVFGIFWKDTVKWLKCSNKVEILPVRAKVSPMCVNDARQTCPFLFPCMLFVSQQVMATEFNVKTMGENNNLHGLLALNGLVQAICLINFQVFLKVNIWLLPHPEHYFLHMNDL